MNKNINKGEISQNNRFLWTCLHFLKVRVRCTFDGPNKGSNYVALLSKSELCWTEY